MEKAPCDQEEKVQQGNLKKALETIASIMTGSIGEVGTHLNRNTESTEAVRGGIKKKNQVFFGVSPNDQA